MGNTQVTDGNEGSQYQPFSEETSLLNVEQPKNITEKKQKMPSFKDLVDRWKNMEYPFNQLSRFY